MVAALHTAEILIAVWLFMLGAVVGSFLNVVIYRLPAGMSLIRPGSHCPHCGKPVRWFDNVPILGWMILNGRCRDCRAPISARYPAVEAVTALVFVGLGLVECLGRGMNLPLRADFVPTGTLVLGQMPAHLCRIYLFHLLLLCTLLPAMWIESEGQRTPVRLFVPALLVGACAPMVWPELRPVPALPIDEGTWPGAVDGLAGLAVGAFLGVLGWRIVGKTQQIATIFGPICVGLILGWQAAGVLTVAAVTIQQLVAASRRFVPGRTTFSPVVWLGVLSLLWLFVWGRLV